MGRGVLDVGNQPSHGSVTKLVGNFFISSLIEIYAEGMSLGERNGVARSSIVELATQLFPGKISSGAALLIVLADLIALSLQHAWQARCRTSDGARQGT